MGATWNIDLFGQNLCRREWELPLLVVKLTPEKGGAELRFEDMGGGGKGIEGFLMQREKIEGFGVQGVGISKGIFVQDLGRDRRIMVAGRRIERLWM